MKHPTDPAFGLAITLLETNHEEASDQLKLNGYVEFRSGASLSLMWFLTIAVEPMSACIEGTRILDLCVIDDSEGQTVLCFENGAWTVPVHDNFTSVLRTLLIREETYDQP